MPGDMLSQEEINALLGGSSDDDEPESLLTPEEIDALGEIGNISMGTAATTLFALLNHRVMITTPKVTILSADELEQSITDDMVATSVDYTVGLSGTNLLILQKRDVRVITDLMMGGSGDDSGDELNELHLSAISEAMNQMIGSSSTSLSQVFNKMIDISPPNAVQLEAASDTLRNLIGDEKTIVKIAFRMQILENIIDSELMQILPISFAKSLVDNLFNGMMGDEPTAPPPPPPPPTPAAAPPPEPMPETAMPGEAGIDPISAQAQPMMNQPMMNQPMMDPMTGQQAGQPMMDPMMQQMMMQQMMQQQQMMGQMQGGGGQGDYEMPNVQAQMPQFQTFHTNIMPPSAENIGILMDVSLEVSVELGRTKKKIREILEFGEGSIVELDKLVGEPIDILVNGKFIASGEVVVIDENFGIRVTNIIKPENRI
ncbi:MAG: hypothetical protein ATN33_08110 [Epulopiscium sp. Nele67-Bin001]|nr:MAG: hypothetical protein ATN33_08110 [Epulopiscium sp. Nele67-Bin001]